MVKGILITLPSAVWTPTAVWRAIGSEMQPCAIDNGLQHRFRFGSVTPFSPKLFQSQVEVEHRLDRLLLGIRLGPMLGLAGTLIPLGPTLLALTAWDFSALSSQLVIAFNATVVGLFIGGACYAVHLV